MDESPPNEYFPEDEKKGPSKATLIVVTVVVLAAVGGVAWLAINAPPGSSQSGPTPTGSSQADPSQTGSPTPPGINNAGPAGGTTSLADLPLEDRVGRLALRREDLDEMIDTPARTIAWAVSLIGFRPPDLAPDAPWDPPSPERVLSMDDPGPIHTSFFRNVAVPGSDYTIDESIDLVLDNDGETAVRVLYTRFTEAPVEDADLFLEIPE